ncbi:DUF3426 domain-containing protein [Cellvibrio sp. NN19]|uniref:DUF3426 domain-containing protein n=1 Tax=Cellvibrio chitinivorans TaxID=3102792 RepID=UPI002B41679D|nr:DUF3426 domain-containing protein [Cellvibrio sp. NN19]
MTSASNQMITRCPKCGTAFRVTASQLQSAKGAVRCGSCLHVFKAQDSLVATPVAPAKPLTPEPTAKTASPVTSVGSTTPAIKSAPAASIEPIQPAKPEQPAILGTIKPLTSETPKPKVASTPKQSAPAAPAKPVIRTINKSSLGQETDDILISDDMEDIKAESNNYEFDGFIDIDATPKSDVSLFERKIRDKDFDEEPAIADDESWAEMLIEDEEDDTPQLGVYKPKIDADQLDEYNADAQLSDEALAIHQTTTESLLDATAPAGPSTTPTATATPGLLFSLVGEQEEPSKAQKQASNEQESDELVLSDELANIPSNQGFNQTKATEDRLDPNIFETPDEKPDSDSDTPKRQVKTQPKIRAYDGSRTALLMNIMPAPIEFNAKRMRRWYQRKLWPSLSILALLALIIQVGWFKFDYFSRVEPYRTGYLFLCPYLGCQVPTLVDTRRIIASNLVVRQHPDTEGALAVDVMLINSAPFDQPFPDLTLTFTDIDENQVAARRFIPKDYLGGELAGQELMPQNQKVYITLDLVDPGAEAVNYHISIPRN